MRCGDAFCCSGGRVGSKSCSPKSLQLRLYSSGERAPLGCWRLRKPSRVANFLPGPSYPSCGRASSFNSPSMIGINSVTVG